MQCEQKLQETDPSSPADLAGCKKGCTLWLAHTSLNWESSKRSEMKGWCDHTCAAVARNQLTFLTSSLDKAELKGCAEGCHFYDSCSYYNEHPDHAPVQDIMESILHGPLRNRVYPTSYPTASPSSQSAAAAAGIAAGASVITAHGNPIDAARKAASATLAAGGTVPEASKVAGAVAVAAVDDAGGTPKQANDIAKLVAADVAQLIVNRTATKENLPILQKVDPLLKSYVELAKVKIVEGHPKEATHFQLLANQRAESLGQPHPFEKVLGQAGNAGAVAVAAKDDAGGASKQAGDAAQPLVKTTDALVAKTAVRAATAAPTARLPSSVQTAKDDDFYDDDQMKIGHNKDAR